jgi:hypothetical protein
MLMCETLIHATGALRSDRERITVIGGYSHPKHQALLGQAPSAEFVAGCPKGSVALSLCTNPHPLHTGFTKTFGTSLSEPTTQPNPRCPERLRELLTGRPLWTWPERHRTLAMPAGRTARTLAAGEEEEEEGGEEAAEAQAPFAARMWSVKADDHQRPIRLTTHGARL